MEIKNIKEKRRKKYLEKMKNKNRNNDYQKENNNAPLINDTTPLPEYQEKCSKSNGEIITKLNYNSNNNIRNSSSYNINNNSENKINYNEILKKINHYEFISVILNIIKKMFIIILSIFHCLNIYYLDNIKRFKYTFIILEISSLIINILIRNKIKIQYQNYAQILDDKSTIKNGLDFNQSIYLLRIGLVYFSFLDYIVQFGLIFIDILVDIAIIFIVNFIFFIINEEDD